MGVFVVLAILTVWEQAQAKRVSNQVEAQKRENAALDARARELEYLEALQTEFETQRSLVQAAWTDEVSWAKVLQEIAAVMPDGVYLTAFTGERGQQSSVPLQGQTQQQQRRQRGQQAQPQGGAEAPLPPSSPSSTRKVIGKITVQASAKSHREVGNWLYRVNRGMPSLTAAWVRNASLSEQEVQTPGGIPMTQAKVEFTSEAYLSPYAMGWMGRCAERGFENLSQAPYGVCGHSFYGAQVPAAPSQPRR